MPARESIEAPFAAASDPEIEKDKAIDNCQLPAIEKREETSWRMCHEVGDRHVTRYDEGNGASEQTEGQQQAATNSNKPCSPGFKVNSA